MTPSDELAMMRGIPSTSLCLSVVNLLRILTKFARGIHLEFPETIVICVMDSVFFEFKKNCLGDADGKEGDGWNQFKGAFDEDK